MSPMIYIIGIPIILGTLCFLLNKTSKNLLKIMGCTGSAFVFFMTIYLFFQGTELWMWNHLLLFNLDALSRFILLFVGFFGFLLSLYAMRTEIESRALFYGSYLWTLGAASGAVLANHLLLFLVFWGILAITLYLMILTGDENAPKAAQKSLILVGGSDALVLLGIGLIYQLAKSYQIDQIYLTLDTPWTYIAFFSLLVGIMTKVGAMPFHTWIPSMATSAPSVVTAFLPAAIDKLLGIYLLVRLSMDVFSLNASIHFILMIIGSVTIIAGVMMALIQHDVQKLLAYHAVSQVGYMILGIGTGHPIGIAGGLFHMLNNTLYKSCLFLVSGAVKKRTGTTDLHQLGGLVNKMPFTFTAFLICAFAISGIPPFNGFASKWMIYQGILLLGKLGDPLSNLWLLAALFGSGLTLASFMKLTHAIFLGTPSKLTRDNNIKEVDGWMVVPMMVLALLCLIMGIFVYHGPVQQFLIPVLGDLKWIGQWDSGWAAFLLLIGCILAFIIYLIGKFSKIREVDHFIGGEELPVEARITGIHFYDTIKEYNGIAQLYKSAEKSTFDIYVQTKVWIQHVSGNLRALHTGILNLYVIWILAGAIVLFLLFMR